MEFALTKKHDQAHQSYLVASLAFWTSIVITALVFFWFSPHFPLFTSLTLAILTILLPIGWFKNYEEYQTVRQVYENSQEQSPELLKLYEVSVRTLTRQLGLVAYVLLFMLNALHATTKH